MVLLTQTLKLKVSKFLSTRSMASSWSRAVPEVLSAVDVWPVSLPTPTGLLCVETLIMDEGRIKTEKEKLRVALRNCGYPEWT